MEVTRNFAFASVVSTKEIKKGTLLDQNNIWVKRPSGGEFVANELESLFGKIAVADIPANTQIKKSQIE